MTSRREFISTATLAAAGIALAPLAACSQEATPKAATPASSAKSIFRRAVGCWFGTIAPADAGVRGRRPMRPLATEPAIR